MANDIQKQLNASKETVLAAIRVIQDKGWDVNPFTVADETHIVPSVLYRSSELMNLIISARNGNLEDPLARLNNTTFLEERIRELEKTIDKLKNRSKQNESKADSSMPSYSSIGDANIIELSWKDLESTPRFSMATLKDYSKQISPLNSETSIRTKQTALKEQSDIQLKLASNDSTASTDIDQLHNSDQLDNLTSADKTEIENENEQSVQAGAYVTPSMALDSELRELLKSRIKQASELLPEAPREPLSLPKESDAFKPVSRSKFVGGAKPPQEPPAPRSIARQVPADIRKACMILGIRPEELTPQVVLNAWKHQIATPGVHPDLGGDTELAIFLNMAKDQLVRWLDPQVPKLAKKFKSTQSTHKQSTP